MFENHEVLAVLGKRNLHAFEIFHSEPSGHLAEAGQQPRADATEKSIRGRHEQAGNQMAVKRCGGAIWDFCQHRTELIARVPRTFCPEHGVLLTGVPWAREGSGFTLMMEAVVFVLCQQMSVSAVALALGCWI